MKEEAMKLRAEALHLALVAHNAEDDVTGSGIVVTAEAFLAFLTGGVETERAKSMNTDTESETVVSMFPGISAPMPGEWIPKDDKRFPKGEE